MLYQYFFSAVYIFHPFFYKLDVMLTVWNKVNHHVYTYSKTFFLELTLLSCFAFHGNKFPCQLHYSCKELPSDLSHLKIISNKLTTAILRFLSSTDFCLFYTDDFLKAFTIYYTPDCIIFNKQGKWKWKWEMERDYKRYVWIQPSDGIALTTLGQYQWAESGFPGL